jgi:hypothetical protein
MHHAWRQVTELLVTIAVIVVIAFVLIGLSGPSISRCEASGGHWAPIDKYDSECVYP